MTNWDKIKRNIKLGKDYSIDSCNSDIYYEKTLKSMDKFKNYNKTKDLEIFNLGIKWFEEGLSLEDADDNYKNHISFVNGYNVAKRRSFINEIDSKPKSK